MTLLLFANTDWYLYNFRLAFAESARREGYRVVLLSPPGPWGERLRAAGFEWRPFDLSRQGMSPLREAVAVLRLCRLYRELRPDLVHHFTVKCVIYGSVAAKVAGVGRILNSITGLGHMMLSNALGPRLMRPAMGWLYRLALAGTGVIFQNRDDLDRFVAEGLVKPEATRLIAGSGVDLGRFRQVPQPESGPPRVVMVGRLLRSKGVGTFVEAARLVRERRPDVEFLVAGEPDPGNPDTLTPAEISAWGAGGGTRFLGRLEDIPKLLAESAIVVLPSLQGEGMPRSLLEGAAVGRPLVASDVPGCREVVREGITGRLVPPGDAPRLAEALLELIGNPGRMANMGAAARADAETRFSNETISGQTLAFYRELPCRPM